MSRSPTVPTVLALSLLSIGAGTSLGQGIPEIIPHSAENARVPTWTALDAVTAESVGRFLRPHELAMYERNMTTPDFEARGCIHLEPPAFALAVDKPHGSVRDIAENSVGIFDGVVSETKQGFYRTIPGTLVEISSTNVLKASSAMPSRSSLYVFVFGGTFTIADRFPVCLNHASLGTIPTRGDRIAVAAFFPPTDADGSVVFPYYDAVFLERQGVLHIPPRWMNTDMADLKSIDELSSAIRGLVQGGGSQARLSGKNTPIR